ncbi:MAG: ORF6N domain-containing protein [Bacteroidota bacterium]
MTEQAIIEAKVHSIIQHIRAQKVIMDSDLAELYGVEVKRLNEQVKRNQDRFPDDFMFQLTSEEWDNLKSQNATPSWGGRRTRPYVFTEQGVAMLSSVLKTKKAIQVNIAIMRTFVKMRKWIANYTELLEKIDQLETIEREQNEHIERIYQIIDELIYPMYDNRKLIGFKRD